MLEQSKEFILKEKEIITTGELIEKLDNPVAKSLYLYLQQERPERLFINSLNEQIFKTKAAACRILMIMATLELEQLGYLKESIHTHDKIEFIYAA